MSDTDKLTEAEIKQQAVADALRLTSGNSFVTSGQIKVMMMAADMLEQHIAERKAWEEQRDMMREKLDMHEVARGDSNQLCIAVREVVGRKQKDDSQ